MLGEAGEVLLLLSKLLLKLEELLLLTLADNVVLIGTLAALEGIAVKMFSLSVGLIEMVLSGNKLSCGQTGNRDALTLGRRSWGEHQYRLQPWHGQ